MGLEISAAATATSASPNPFVSTVIVVHKARVIEMRAAGHFRLLHGFLLHRLSTTTAAAAGQFVSVPALPSRDSLAPLQPIQSFIPDGGAPNFSPVVLSPDRLPLLLVGDVDDGGAGLVLCAVAGLLFLGDVAFLVPQAHVPTGGSTPGLENGPREAQVHGRQVLRSKETG